MRSTLTFVGVVAGLTVMASTAYAVQKPMTLKLSENGGGSVVIDRGQVGRSVGDTIAFSHALTNRARQLSKPQGGDVGTTSGICQVLRVDQRRLCRWQFDLSNGTLVVAGIVRVDRWSPLAIIGGSGAYANVRGDATRHRVSGTRVDWILRLRP
jgi:hypothetical protein